MVIQESEVVRLHDIKLLDQINLSIYRGYRFKMREMRFLWNWVSSS